MVCRYELTTTAMRPAMANPIGIEKCNAVVPARTRMRRISSVAYATEDSASDEKTARAAVLESRSWRACAVARGLPTSTFLRGLSFNVYSRRPYPSRAARPGQGSASTQNSGYRRAPHGSEVTVTHSAEEGTVTRASLREYATRQRARYERADRRQKQALLDEIVAVTGMHRKAVIRLLRRPLRSVAAPSRAGRPRQYGPEVAAAVELLWQASGRIGAHRLHPFVPELLDRLLRWDEVRLSPAIDKLVRQASRATLARLLAPARTQYPLRGAGTTQPSSWLKQQIPLRTFADWDEAVPGYCEIDLVAHCASSTEGFYLYTLCAVDIATSWVELQAVWGKGQHRVTAAIHEVRQRLPMPLRGIDSDNGSEFINQTLYGYCIREGITFTCSRAWKKNDSPHVEQKN